MRRASPPKTLSTSSCPTAGRNGDPSNDRIPGLKDQSLNRDSIFFRHGGDLQGILNHLDYLQSLGVTTLWMTPVILNDMPNRTEHGYAFTDHYTIDPRLGGPEMYKRLADSLHMQRYETDPGRRLQPCRSL